MAWYAPLDWRPSRVRGFRLRFNLDGRPRGKAAPANLFPDPKAEVAALQRHPARPRPFGRHGRYPWSWYLPLWLDVEDINGNPFGDDLIANGKEVDGRPSLRSLTLLRDGARAHGLPEHYIRFLDNVEEAP